MEERRVADLGEGAKVNNSETWCGKVREEKRFKCPTGEANQRAAETLSFAVGKKWKRSSKEQRNIERKVIKKQLDYASWLAPDGSIQR